MPQTLGSITQYKMSIRAIMYCVCGECVHSTHDQMYDGLDEARERVQLHLNQFACDENEVNNIRAIQSDEEQWNCVD